MPPKATGNLFRTGDRVSARWAGSNVFYDALVMDVTTRTYKVQFDDGSVSKLKHADVKNLSSKSSPKKTVVKTKSRSRSRSAGRGNRSRSKSPARKERKPPAPRNEKKTPPKESRKKSESTSNSNSVSKDEIDSVVVKSPLSRDQIGSSSLNIGKLGVSPLNAYMKVSRGYSEVYEKEVTHTRPRGRPPRLSAVKSPEVNRTIFDSKTITESFNAKTSTEEKYSDDEDEEEIAPKMAISKSLQTFYFIGTLFKIILVPTSLLFFVFSCTKRQCTVLEIPQFYSKWRDMGNAIKYPIAGIFVFHLLQCLLALIPLGRKVRSFSTESSKKTYEYRLNGLMILAASVIILGVCSYFGVSLNWGYDKFRGIALSSALYCIIFAIGLHIYAAVKGDSTTHTKVPFLGKFYSGSYINPVLFGKVDLKTSLIRTGLMGSVLLNLCILLKFFLMKRYLTVPLALTSGMQVFFVFDAFVREEKLLSTATYTSDTVGYAFILTTGFLIPIGLALQNVYLFIFEAKSGIIPHWCSAAMACLFFVGYYIYLSSTNLKHNFRSNPFSPSLSDVVSIPTSKKKRLVASGWWGRIRHPNYLGLLIMATAWTLPCGFSHVVPFGPLILLAISLIVRCFRIEAECKERYGPAWSNYTEKVHSRLIPYIF